MRAKGALVARVAPQYVHHNPPGPGRTTRRVFLARATATAAWVGGLGSSLGACAPQEAAEGAGAAPDETASTRGPVSETAADAGRAIGVGNTEGEPPSLDWGVIPNFSAGQTVGSTLHAYLLKLSPDGELASDLADEYEQTSPTEYSFHLRENASFHDGTPVTADSVKASFERLVDAESGSYLAGNLAVIEGIEVPDPQTVVFALNESAAYFLTLTTLVPIVPVDSHAAQQTEPVGAGPYAFKKWDKGNVLEVERFDGYYASDHVGVEGVSFLPRSDAAALRAAFMSGEADVILNYYWVDNQALEAAGANVSATPTPVPQMLLINHDKPPFDDRVVREALSLAIDRQQLAETQAGPEAESNALMIPRSSRFFPGDLEAPPHDPARASSLLREAGVVEGTDIEIIIPDHPFYRPLAPLLQAMGRAVGLNVTTPVLGVAETVDRVLVRKDYQLTLWGDAGADPALLLNRYLMSEGANNVIAYSNPALDSVLDEAAATIDEAQRADLYGEAMAIFVEDNPILVYMDSVANLASAADVDGIHVLPNMLLDFSTATIGG